MSTFYVVPSYTIWVISVLFKKLLQRKGVRVYSSASVLKFTSKISHYFDFVNDLVIQIQLGIGKIGWSKKKKIDIECSFQFSSHLRVTVYEYIYCTICSIWTSIVFYYFLFVSYLSCCENGHSYSSINHIYWGLSTFLFTIWLFVSKVAIASGQCCEV